MSTQASSEQQSKPDALPSLLPKKLLSTPICVLMLSLITLLVYLPQVTEGFDFTNWDDNWLITSNHHIRSLSSENLSTILDPTIPISVREELGNEYLPVRDLSYSLNYAIHGYDPWGYHALNLLLHMLNVMLVFSLMRRISGNQGLALAAGLLFATLPIHVEVVSWLSSRKDLLATFFVLLGIREYLRFRARWGVRGSSRRDDQSVRHRAPDAGRDENRREPRGGIKVWLAYAFAVMCFVLAMLSKVPAIVMPGLLVVIEVFGVRRAARVNLRTLAVLIAPFAVVSFAFFAIALPLAQNGLIREPFGNSHWYSMLTSTAAFGEYFLSFLVGSPAGAGVDFPVKQSVDAGVIASLSVIIAAVLLSLWGVVKAWSAGKKGESPLVLVPASKKVEQPELTLGRALLGFAMGVAFAMTAFVPVSNAVYVTGTAYADRYAYLPSIGWCLGFAFLGAYLLRLIASKLPSAKLQRVVPLLIAVLVIGWYGVKANLETRDWKNSFTLWQSVLESDPENHLAHFNLARARHEEALAEADKSVSRKELLVAAESYQAAIDNPARTYRYDPARAYGALAQLHISLIHLDQSLARDTLSNALRDLREESMDLSQIEARGDVMNALRSGDELRSALLAPEEALEEAELLAILDVMRMPSMQEDDWKIKAWKGSLADQLKVLLPRQNALGTAIRWSPEIDAKAREIYASITDGDGNHPLLAPDQLPRLTQVIENRASTLQREGWIESLIEVETKLAAASEASPQAEAEALSARQQQFARVRRAIADVLENADHVRTLVANAEQDVLLPWRNPKNNARDFLLIRAVLQHTLAQLNAAVGRHTLAIQQARAAIELSEREPAAYLNLAAELAARAAWRMDVLLRNSVANGVAKETLQKELSREFERALNLVHDYESQVGRSDVGSLTTFGKLKARQAELVEDAKRNASDQSRKLYAEAAHAYKQAISLLETQGAQATELYSHLMLRAEILQRDDDTEQEAIFVLEKAMELMPDRPEAPTIRAKLLLRKGTAEAQEKGIRSLQSILRRHPEYQPAREDLGAIYLAKASDDWKKLRERWIAEYRLEMKAQNEPAPEELADFIVVAYYLPINQRFRDEIEAIKKTFRDALSLTEPKSAIAKAGAAFLTELGLAFAQLGDAIGSEKLLIEALKYDDVNDDAAKTLAGIYFIELERAVQDWLQTLQVGTPEEIEQRRAFMHSLVQGLILASEEAAQKFSGSLSKLANRTKIRVAEEHRSQNLEISERDIHDYVRTFGAPDAASAQQGTLLHSFSTPELRSDFYFDLTDDQREKIKQADARREQLMERVADLYSMAWTVWSENAEALSQLKDYYEETGNFQRAVEMYDRLSEADFVQRRLDYARHIANARAGLLMEWGRSRYDEYRDYTRDDQFDVADPALAEQANVLREEVYDIFSKAAKAHEIAMEYSPVVPKRELLASWSACYQVMANIDLSNAVDYLRKAIEILEIRPDAFGDELREIRERIALLLRDKDDRLNELRAALKQLEKDIQNTRESEELGDLKEKVLERKYKERARLIDRINLLQSQLTVEGAARMLEQGDPKQALKLSDAVTVRTSLWYKVRGQAYAALGQNRAAADHLQRAKQDVEAQLLGAELLIELGEDTDYVAASECLARAQEILRRRLNNRLSSEDRIRLHELLNQIAESYAKLEVRSGQLLRKGLQENSERTLRLAVEMAPNNYLAREALADLLLKRALINYELAADEATLAETLQGVEAEQANERSRWMRSKASEMHSEALSMGMRVVMDSDVPRFRELRSHFDRVLNDEAWQRMGELQRTRALKQCEALFAFLLRDLRILRNESEQQEPGAYDSAQIDEWDASFDSIRQRFVELGGDASITREGEE